MTPEAKPAPRGERGTLEGGRVSEYWCLFWTMVKTGFLYLEPYPWDGGFTIPLPRPRSIRLKGNQLSKFTTCATKKALLTMVYSFLPRCFVAILVSRLAAEIDCAIHFLCLLPLPPHFVPRHDLDDSWTIFRLQTDSWVTVLQRGSNIATMLTT